MTRRRNNWWDNSDPDPIEFETPEIDEPPPDVLRKIAHLYELTSDGYGLVHRWARQPYRATNIKINDRVMRTRDVVSWFRDRSWPWVRAVHPHDCSCYKCSRWRSTFLESDAAD